MRSRTPAAKFSVTASETATNSRSNSLARSVRMFNVMPRLVTLWFWNPEPNSMPRRSSLNGGEPRRMSHLPSRTGSSIRMTSAPKAPRCRVAPAPASCPVKSQILRWPSAVGLIVVFTPLRSPSTTPHTKYVGNYTDEARLLVPIKTAGWPNSAIRRSPTTSRFGTAPSRLRCFV